MRRAAGFAAVLMLVASACSGSSSTETTAAPPPPPPSSPPATPAPTPPPTPPPATTTVASEPVITYPAGWTELASGHPLFSIGVEAAASMNGTIVVVGWDDDLAAAIVSSDGVTWSRANVDNEDAGEAEFLSVVASEFGFVGVGWAGSNPAIWTSPDGLEWDLRVIDDIEGEFWHVASSPMGLIAFGDGFGADRESFAYSSRDDRSWMQMPRLPWATDGIADVEGGSSGFAAIDYTGGSWFTSDLLTWTQGEELAEGEAEDIAFHDGLFVAVGSSGGAPVIWTSSDGMTWDEQAGFEELGLDPADYTGGFHVIPTPAPAPGQEPPPPPPEPAGSLWLEWVISVGGRLLAGDSEDPDLVSTDGRDWSGDLHWEEPDDLYRIFAILEGGTGLVMLGEPEDHDGLAAWTSVDGARWTRSDAAANPLDDFQFTSVIRGGPGVVATGFGITGGAILTSDDGATWDRFDTGPGWVTDVAIGGPGLVAIGINDEDELTAWSSADGTIWETHPQFSTDSFIISLAATGPGLVGVGVDHPFEPLSAVVWLSCDGARWREVPRDPARFVPGFMLDVAGNGTESVVAVGFDGSWVSPDGITWERVGLPGDAGSVVEFDSGYVAAGDGLWLSRDGTAWTELRAPFEDAEFGIDAFVANHNDGLLLAAERFDEPPGIWTSVDGNTWNSIPTAELGVDAALRGIVPAGDGFIALGSGPDFGARVWSWQPEDFSGPLLLPPSAAPNPVDEAACEDAVGQAIAEVALDQGELPAGVVPSGSIQWYTMALFAESLMTIIDESNDLIDTYLAENPDVDNRTFVEYVNTALAMRTDDIAALNPPPELEEPFFAYVQARRVEEAVVQAVLDDNPDLTGLVFDDALNAAFEAGDAGLPEACWAMQDIFDLNGIGAELNCPPITNFDDIEGNL